MFHLVYLIMISSPSLPWYGQESKWWGVMLTFALISISGAVVLLAIEEIKKRISK